MNPEAALRLTAAIQAGDTATLADLLEQDPGVVHIRFDGQRTQLHAATDWPGHFPNVRRTIELLAAHGADCNAPFRGSHSETPLHWAASCGDPEAPGGVIGGGTALADAVAFGNWPAARRLVERGARTTLWQAAALGLMDRLLALSASDPAPSAAEVTNAFWSACHGGQLETAQFLLARGADLHWIGHDRLSPLDAALRGGHAELAAWLRGQSTAVSRPAAP